MFLDMTLRHPVMSSLKMRGKEERDLTGRKPAFMCTMGDATGHNIT